MAFSPSTLNNAGGQAPFGGNVSRQLRHCIALACLLAPTLAGAQSATVLDDARRLIGEGRAADAYRLLASNEIGLAGQPLYDYLYGVAALDAGHPAQAITALERVVANDPGSASARLELGRAYYEAGNRPAAERQFRAVLAGTPAPTARATANAYLRSMQPQAARASGLRGGYSFGAGYDSNANASTSDRTFLGVTLDPASVETSSSFAQLAGWLDHSRAVGAESMLATSARLGHRFNPDADFVDQTIAALATTLHIGNGPTVFSIGGGGYYGLLDGDAHHWVANIDLALSRSFGDGWRATGLARAGLLRYEDDLPGLSVLDMDQQRFAFSLQRLLESGDFGFTVFAGHDDADQAGSPFGNERLGLQFQAGSQTAGGTGLRVQLGYQDINYDDSPGFFGSIDRSDSAWSAALSAEIHDWPMAGMSLLPRIGWSSNDSNIPLYEYQRFEIGLTLRRSFQ